MWFEEAVDSIVLNLQNKTLQASVGAGMFAGVCGIFVGYPFDTMKVKLQFSAIGQRQEQIPFNFKGIQLLYKGVLIPMITAGLMQSLNFGLYDTSKRYILKKWSNSISEVNSAFIGGAASGLLMSIITTPAQLLKIQLQTHVTLTLSQLLYRDIYQTGRWYILYRGFAVTAFSDCLGRGIYMYSYEASKKFLIDVTNNEYSPLTIRMISAAYAGVISWLLLFPADTIKTLVQSTYFGPSARTYLFQLTKDYKGIRVLYRGCLYAVIRAAPVAATILPLYEYTQEYFLNNL